MVADQLIFLGIPLALTLIGTGLLFHTNPGYMHYVVLILAQMMFGCQGRLLLETAKSPWDIYLAQLSLFMTGVIFLLFLIETLIIPFMTSRKKSIPLNEAAQKVTLMGICAGLLVLVAIVTPVIQWTSHLSVTEPQTTTNVIPLEITKAIADVFQLPLFFPSNLLLEIIFCIVAAVLWAVRWDPFSN